jgi:Ca-activated chloride channel family protein
VQRYRQIGYDLHQLKKEDFRDNTVDAAEIGEAESGTALYVLKIDDDPEIIGGLGTLHVRYLDPASGLYHEHSWPLPMPRRVPAARAASPSMRLAMSSAFFGERLAASPYASGYSFHDLYIMTSGLPDAFPNQPRVAQMQSMLLQASELYGER